MDASESLLINGDWCAADSGKTLDVINPATEETAAQVSYGGREETQRALAAAANALPAWRERNAWGRAEILKKTSAILRERVDEIGKILTTEQGKPLT